jgi:hypothetical protein
LGFYSRRRLAGGLGFYSRRRLAGGLGYGGRWGDRSLESDLIATIGIKPVIPMQARASMFGYRPAGTTRLQRPVGYVAFASHNGLAEERVCFSHIAVMLMSDAHVEHGNGVLRLVLVIPGELYPRSIPVAGNDIINAGFAHAHPAASGG